MRALLALARADIVLYLSNRRALVVTLVAPVLIAAFFGAVLGGPSKAPQRVPVALTNLDTGATAKAIVEALVGEPSLEVSAAPEATAIDLVRRGKVRAAIVIPPGFGEQAEMAVFRASAPKPEIVVHFDPSQAVTLSIVRGALMQHVTRIASAGAMRPGGVLRTLAAPAPAAPGEGGEAAQVRRDLQTLFDAADRLQKRQADGSAGAGTAAAGMSMPFATRDLEVTSPGARRYNSYAHAFAGMSVQFVMFMGIELGMAVLLMRRQGLWKRLRAAPLTRPTLLGSRIVSGTVIATILMAGIYAAALAFFGVRVEGSIVGFAGVVLAFAVFTAVFGLLIAALGRSPEATRGIAIVATLLLVMLGGAWVPTFVFPEWLQQAALVTPTRWAIDGLEAMTWRGLDGGAALAPIGVLLGFSVVGGAWAVRRFDWEE